MLKALIFDMDGVLIDSHPIHKNAWRRFLSMTGKNVSDADLDFVLDGRKREDILRHFLGDLSAEEITAFGHMKELLFREEALNMAAIEGLTVFLQEAKAASLPMAVASCGSASRVQFVLDQFSLLPHFAVIVSG